MLLAQYRSSSFIERACGEGFDVIFNYGCDREPQGLGWCLLMCILKNTFDRCISSYVPLCVVMFLGCLKARVGSSTTKNTPSQFQRGSLCSFPPSSGPPLLGSASTFSSFLVSTPIFSPSVVVVFGPDGL